MIHAPFRQRFPRRSGFTLIELLVVVGLIVLLVGGGALALTGRGSEGAAMTNAQSLLSGLVGATRAQAALHQTSARLIIYAQLPPTGDASKYLRSLQVVRQETLANGTTVWVAASDPVTLPSPVCVVPPITVPRDHLNTGVTWSTNVATGPISTLQSQFFGLQNQSGRIHYLQFAADGTVESNTTGNPTKIAVSTAVLGVNAIPRFNNATGVRGLFVRKTGAISLVDDATGF
jgi:prepilin-type N-terminal cleavage/methylation domain-containing protein